MPKLIDAIMMKRKGAMPEEEMPMEEEAMEEEGEDSGLEQCAMELIDSIKDGDVQGVIGALRSAFHIMESQPHEEGEHIGEEEEMPEGEE